MVTNRKPISKKTRFEVFKRDSFKCQYCGKSAPDVILHVDHIHPVSKGGGNDILNYLTACADCNGGKSDILLSDDSVVSKQKAQLDELSARREQLKQMLAWRDGMRNIADTSLIAAECAWSAIICGLKLNESGQKDLAKLISKFGLPCVLDAIEKSDKYLAVDTVGNTTPESASLAFSKIGGICRMSLQPDWRRDLYYIRGIARNRFNYINQNECIRLLESAYHSGIDIEDLRGITLSCSTWSKWQYEIASLIGT